MNVRNLIIALPLLVAGCGSITAESSNRPRSLGLGVLQPNCFILCFATNTQTDAEANAKQTATTSNSTSTSLAVEGIGK